MSNLRFVSQIALLLLGWLLPQALAQEQLSFEEAQKRLLQSPQWKIIDQQYQLAERSLNIARGAAGLHGASRRPAGGRLLARPQGPHPRGIRA